MEGLLKMAETHISTMAYSSELLEVTLLKALAWVFISPMMQGQVEF